MAVTQTWLETYNAGGRLALSVVFDGVNLVACTLSGSDATALIGTFATAGAPWSDYTVVSPGLMAEGQIAQRLELYTPEIEPGNPTFTVVDVGGTLAALLLREGNDHSARTYLTSTVAAGSSSNFNVKSTTNFDASGTGYIGHEQFEYTGKTATTLTGITRAVNTIFETDDGDPFVPAHLVQENTSDSPQYRPAVTMHPRPWYGRFCTVLLHVYDPTAGTWSGPADARHLWVGRIKNYTDNGDGSISFTCEDAKALMQRSVMGQQWQARLNEGIHVTSTRDTIISDNTAAAAYSNVAVLTTLTDTAASHEEIADAINAQFNTWAGAGFHAGDTWSLELRPDPSGGPSKYRLHASTPTTPVTGSNAVTLWLHRDVWTWLGFTHVMTEAAASTGDKVCAGVLKKTTAAGVEHYLDAAVAPGVYHRQQIGTGSSIFVNDEEGTWVNQPANSLNATPSSEGVISLGGALYAVAYTAGSPTTLSIQARLDPATGKFTPAWGFIGDEGANGIVRLGDADDAPLAKQVWYEGDADGADAGTLLLKLMLSTGTAGHNHNDYDVYTGAGFGLSIPSSLVDATSFLQLDIVQMRLVLDGPTPFHQILEPILAVAGCHLVWKSTGATTQPKLTVVRPTFESTYQSTWALTESNKAGAGEGSADRTKVTRSPDGLINRFVLKYGDGVSSTANTITVENVASQSDFGRKRTVTIEAPNVVNAADLFPQTMAAGVAYFSRPLAVASRTINHTLSRSAPGDSASLVDNYVMHPLTGVRGEGSIYCWILGTQFDLSTLTGSIEAVFLPEKDPSRTAPWAWSARVDETAGGAGYNAGTKTLTLKQHEFSNAAAGTDATYAAAGDAVHIYSLDEAAPLEWTDVIASVGANSVVLTTGLAGFDTAKVYVIEYDDITSSSNGDQRAHAFIADDADLTTGLGSNETPYEWGIDEALPYADTTVDLTTGCGEPASGADNKGEPASAHKAAYAVKAANSLLAYKTCQVHINTCTDAPVTVGPTEEIIFVQKIPLYGHVSLGGIRGLKCRTRFLTSAATGTVKFYSSPSPPTGGGHTSFTILNSNSVAVTSTSGSYAWSAEASLTPAPVNNQGQWETWIIVTASHSAAGTVTVSGVSVREATL